MTPPNSPALTYSVRDAAILTSLSEWEIRDAINKEELAAVRRGRRILIPAENLAEWLRSLPKVGDVA